MNLSTQLRIILLLVGAAVWLAIYLFGKRKTAQPDDAASAADDLAEKTDQTPKSEQAPGFAPADSVADDEFETPAYLRRQGQREPRQDYEPRIADANDYLDVDVVDDEAGESIAAGKGEQQTYAAQAFDEPAEDLARESLHAGPRFDQPVYVEPPPVESGVAEPAVAVPFSRREPTITLDEFVVADDPVDEFPEAVTAVHTDPVAVFDAEPPTEPSIPVVEHPVDAVTHGYAQRAEAMTGSPSSAAPTLSDVVPTPAERVSVRTQPATARSAATQAAAATSGKSAASAARRKIVALRVPMPKRVSGAQLLPLLQGERLQHGKFSIFHRMQDGGTVFSVASMVEPGTFDPQAMSEQQFPGVTLFMLLPGPVDGLVAWDQMLSCAQRIAHATGGVLQDERGNQLTPQTMEKLRDEVLDFQHLIGSVATVT